LWCAVALSGSGKAVLVDRVVATVGTQAITRSALVARVKTGELSERDTLERLIDERLITADCLRLGVVIGADEVELAISEVLKSAKLSQQQLEQELRRHAMDMEAYRASVKMQLLEMKWLGTKGGPTTRGETSEQWYQRVTGARDKWVAELRAKTAIEVRL
jgi:hypothetical protein